MKWEAIGGFCTEECCSLTWVSQGELRGPYVNSDKGNSGTSVGSTHGFGGRWLSPAPELVGGDQMS